MVLAGIIAIPVGYFGLNQWLQSYAYHVEIGWFPIFVSLFLSVVLAILTTGSMPIKAAYANPADALRNE